MKSICLTPSAFHSSTKQWPRLDPIHTPTSDARDDDDAAVYMRRRLSVSSTNTNNLDTAFTAFSPSSSPRSHPQPDPKIVLRPSLVNNSIHQLSTLSHSNHTLSPYTRSFEHFAVRSGPPRWSGGSGAAGHGLQGSGTGERQQPVKARRKRTFRINRKLSNKGTWHTDATVLPPLMTPPLTPELESATMPRNPPSEFDPSDMDRYFHSFDDRDYGSHELARTAAGTSSALPPSQTTTTSMLRQRKAQHELSSGSDQHQHYYGT